MITNRQGAPLKTLGEISGQSSFEELISFPTAFTFKVIVRAEEDYGQVIALIEGIAGSKLLKRGQPRWSKKGTYCSCDLEFRVEDAAMLRRIYAQAGTHPKVVHIL